MSITEEHTKQTSNRCDGKSAEHYILNYHDKQRNEKTWVEESTSLFLIRTR